MNRLFEVKRQTIPPKMLHEKYIVPPFSVFNTHQTYWKERTKFWNDLGVGGTNGRVTGMNGLCYDNRRIDKHKKTAINGTSTFSPVLCEIMYKWFTMPNSNIIDPFAGGITRGAVASILNHIYVGFDINETQCESNDEEMWKLKEKYVIDGSTTYVNEDIRSVIDYDKIADFIFTCPPYYNLEVYSDNPRDLSTKTTYEEFLIEYLQIIEKCYNILRDDCFMAWVVSDVRNKQTTEYYGLVADTIKGCQNCGFKFYNEIILYNDTSNLAIVSGDYLKLARKVGRQHQNILIFYKGNPKNIRDKFGSII